MLGDRGGRGGDETDGDLGANDGEMIVQLFNLIRVEGLVVAARLIRIKHPISAKTVRSDKAGGREELNGLHVFVNHLKPLRKSNTQRARYGVLGTRPTEGGTTSADGDGPGRRAVASRTSPTRGTRCTTSVTESHKNCERGGDTPQPPCEYPSHIKHEKKTCYVGDGVSQL